MSISESKFKVRTTLQAQRRERGSRHTPPPPEYGDSNVFLFIYKDLQITFLAN